jgi:putative ABC transport system permease protein
MTSDYSRLVLVAIVIAIPLSYFILNDWLNNFPYHRELEIWIFIAASIIGWLTAVLTVFFQTIRASMVNPVETLKYE